VTLEPEMGTILMVSLIISSLILSLGLGALLIVGFLNLVSRLLAR
jgi:predicted membrane-bound spermidine synthase